MSDNDTVVAFGQPEKQILFEPLFAEYFQAASGKAVYQLNVLLASPMGPQPGHFSRTLAKGSKTTTWIWKDGSYIEYYENVQICKGKNNRTIVQYLQTTTGRVLLNYTIQTTLSLN